MRERERDTERFSYCEKNDKYNISHRSQRDRRQSDRRREREEKGEREIVKERDIHIVRVNVGMTNIT